VKVDKPKYVDQLRLGFNVNSFYVPGVITSNS